jgi:hypothetical protein
MSNFQYRKSNLVCKTKTAVFFFTAITKSELVWTKQFLRPLAQAST